MARKNTTTKLVATLNDTHRIIEDARGIQWMLQRKYKSGWASISYCRTREGLLGLLSRYAPSLVECINLSAYRAVSTLPERL